MDFVFDVCYKNRAILERFFNDFSTTQLNKIPQGFNNSIIWNIAHVIVTQQILTYEMAGVDPNVPAELITAFRKGTKPTEFIDGKKIEQIKSLLYKPIDKTIEDLKTDIFNGYQPYTVSTGSTLSSVKDALHFNNFHEGLHLGYLFSLRKFV